MALERYEREGSVAVLAERLLTSLRAWRHELNHLHLPWGRAIAELCASRVEQLLRISARVLVSSTQAAALGSVPSAGQGRCIAGMKMDQLAEVLSRLESMLTEKLERQCAPPGHEGSLLSSRDRRLLHRLSKMRGDIADKARSSGDARQQALQWLSYARQLCQSHLVATVRALEARSGYSQHLHKH